MMAENDTDRFTKQTKERYIIEEIIGVVNDGPADSSWQFGKT